MLAVAVLTALIAVTAGALLIAHRRWPADTDGLLNAVNAALPQTQCAQCGYPGCLPYARAVVDGEAINLCPPGGEATLLRLRELLPAAPIADASLALPQPLVARIDESRCIGCFLCIDACPVDAIVGAQKFMHTVVTEQCTGCELCIAPCPVDCITLIAT